MLVVCWSPKGGSGTSVVTAAIALAMANTSDRKVLTVDLAGDLPAVFGIAEPAGPGLSEWLAAGDDVGAAALHRLSIDVTESLQLLTWGRHSSPAAAESARWRRLADHLANLDTDVVIDAGRRPPPELVEVASRSLLVIRPCYLGLHRATSSAAQPTGGDPGARTGSSVEPIRCRTSPRSRRRRRGTFRLGDRPSRRCGSPRRTPPGGSPPRSGRDHRCRRRPLSTSSAKSVDG